MVTNSSLRISQVNEPCIGLTYENLIEFLVQYIYLYILISNSLYLAISSLL